MKALAALLAALVTPREGAAGGAPRPLRLGGGVGSEAQAPARLLGQLAPGRSAATCVLAAQVGVRDSDVTVALYLLSRWRDVGRRV